MKYCKFVRLFFLFVCFSGRIFATEEEIITVDKKGVLYSFVKGEDESLNYFITHLFPDWKNENFENFDKIKNEQGIAIDIGAWIGTNSIWLAKNFRYVIAVDANKESVKYLRKNLEASKCPNVTICERPIFQTTEEVTFGPRGTHLTEATCQIKLESDNDLDSTLRSLTFKQLIFDYIYANPRLNQSKISFINCDIEGGEESILEDILHFAYYNKCAVQLSFYTNLWQKKQIKDFKYLFKYFDIKCPDDACTYIERNPNCSLLFEPKADAGVLVKKNLPMVIIGWNQFTFIKNMVSQLEKYSSDIIIIDNNSDYQPLLDYYQNDFKYTLLKQPHNFGYTIYQSAPIQQLVGDLYVLTDPDLTFNSELPDNFLHHLIGVSNAFGANRVGFALKIDAADLRTDLTYLGCSIRDWESRYWTEKLDYPINPQLQLFRAPIDTTFCLINNRHNYQLHIRVGGNYTCIHIPWHKNFEKDLLPGEYEHFIRNNNSSCWLRQPK